MKILALLASPHGLKGNTAGLLRHVLDGAESAGARSRIFVLKGDTVLPCRACDFCHRKGRCVQKDGFESLRKEMMSADGLVLASPNYIFQVSAQMKAFMDRCCGVIHCMSFWDKYGASVVTSGGGEEKPIAEYMNHFLITTGAIPVGSVWATMSAMPDGGFTDEVIAKARSLGKRLVKSWQKGKISPGTERQRQAFRDRMTSLITWRGDEWPYERDHWESIARKNPGTCRVVKKGR